ncbi:TetR family transcriptional regulator [Streptomyces sp. TP-A0874]|uniref:TetR family transcriptional regulator n=1 Tax=Streptomyces sp. TP-A0874 TaxID=549819 RepID=UPI000852E49A
MRQQAPEAARTGLRERKKQHTRNALIRTALQLFTTQGYERTTVDEIAETVELSQRTFFRYFANKEEVAFAVQAMVEEHFLTALRNRPPDEPPMTALRRSAAVCWANIAQVIGDTVPAELHLRMYRLIESTPALLAVHLRRCTELEERIAQEIARREGVDPETDPRPRVLVAAFAGVTRVTGRVWNTAADGEHTVEALCEISETYLDHLAPALTEPWRSSRKQTTG